MWKIAIIDDEKIIVQGLQVLIDWKELDIEVICATTNPADVLAVAGEIDFLLTDVQMPTMTGLDLIEQVKRKQPLVQCVILSGYDDFQYAKKGMAAGASHYLLKPVNEVEIYEVFQKLKMTSQQKKYEIEAMKAQHYHAWQQGSGLEAISQQLPLLQSGQAYYLFESYEKFSVEPHVNIEWIFDHPKKIGVYWFEQGQGDEAKQWLKQKNVKSISKQGSGEAEFIPLFQALTEIMVHERQQTIIWDEFQAQALDFAQALEKVDKFQHLFVQAEFELIEAVLIAEFKQPYKKQDLINLLMLYLLALQQLSVTQQLQWELPEKQTIHQCVGTLVLLPTSSEILNHVIRWSLEVHSEYHNRLKSYTPIVRRVITLVEKKYSEDLSLKVLSHELNMNTSYLGQIFKEELGMSFNMYINKIRMEKAHELLLHSNLKINQIAQEIGFQDNSYFYRKFKTFYGYCPNIVRKNQIE